MRRTIANLAVVVCVAAIAISGNRTLADHAFVRVIGDWEQSDGGKSLEQHFRFANDLAAYGLTYTIAIPDGTPPGKCTSRVWAFKTKDVTLGMSAPVGANWYTQAFSSVRIDGLSLHDIPGTFRIVRPDGNDALVEGLWDTPKGPFSMRLLLRADDDKLLVQYVLPSENSGKHLDVRLVAYPHGFQKPWDRHMATATREIGQQSGVVLDPAMERWALFYDEGMWKTKAGGGPCGFVCAPDEVEPPRVTVDPYSVAVHLRTKPEVRQITVGLWDFTTTPDVAAVRSYLRSGGEGISDDVAALAKTDWLADVASPAQLPAPRREELIQLVAERRKPTPFDTMTTEIATPHVTWAKPLPDGPVRTLVVCPRWYQRETVELAQRLDLDCQTVSLAGPDELFNATWLYLYGSYDAYGYKRKTEIDVLDELNRAIRADCDCVMLSGFKPRILPASLRRALMEKTRGGSGLILLGDCRALLKELGDSLQPMSWDGGTVPLERLPGLNQMVAEGRPLDDLFGVRRAGVPKHDGNAAIQVSMNGLHGDLQLDTYDAGLQTETATAWAAGGDVPAVLVRDVGRGRTVVLNADIGRYESLRSTGTANPVRRLMSHLLEKADVRPQVRVVDKQGDPVPACEVVRFADGGLTYVAVVSDHRMADAKTQEVSIHLPAQAVVCDIRKRELLGKTKVVQRTLVPGDPLALALMPYVVERPIIEPKTHKCAPGEVPQFVVRLSLGGQAPAGHHCLRVEAISPDGSCRRCDTQNVLTSQNKTAVSIPLPLNAPAGAWKLRVTDVASGKAATAGFRVDPR